MRVGSLATPLKDRNSKGDNGATHDGLKVLQSRGWFVRADSVKEVQIGFKIQVASIDLYLGRVDPLYDAKAPVFRFAS